MNQRGVLIIILSILVVFTIAVVSFIGIYKFYPNLFGIKSKLDSLEIDSIYTEPLLTITEQQMDKYQTEILNKEMIEEQKDSLEKVSKRLSNKIGNIKSKIILLNDSISHIHKIYSKKQGFNRTLKDSIKKLQREFKKTSSEKQIAEEQIKRKNKEVSLKIDSIKLSNIKAFAKMYNTTNPSDVAKILGTIDPKEAAMILKFMQKKKAGKVLEVMKPEKAAEILLKGNK